jgi:hypothetical protein
MFLPLLFWIYLPPANTKAQLNQMCSVFLLQQVKYLYQPKKNKHLLFLISDLPHLAGGLKVFYLIFNFNHPIEILPNSKTPNEAACGGASSLVHADQDICCCCLLS